MINYRHYFEKPDSFKFGEIIKAHLNEFSEDYLFGMFLNVYLY